MQIFRDGKFRKGDLKDVKKGDVFRIRSGSKVRVASEDARKNKDGNWSVSVVVTADEDKE